MTKRTITKPIAVTMPATQKTALTPAWMLVTFVASATVKALYATPNTAAAIVWASELKKLTSDVPTPMSSGVKVDCAEGVIDTARKLSAMRTPEDCPLLSAPDKPIYLPKRLLFDAL